MTTPVMFWAKSDAGGQPHSLIAHSLDSGAVADLMWSDFLSPHLRDELDRVSGNRGRDLLVLACGWHDLGKATPAFQAKALSIQKPDLVAPLREQLGAPKVALTAKAWPHGKAGALIVRQLIHRKRLNGWDWFLPLVQGHHGAFGETPEKPPRTLLPMYGHGDPRWQEQQELLAECIADRAGIVFDGWHLETPSIGIQLAVAGLVSMADWIASSDLFPGIGLADMSFEEAKDRASRAWDSLAFQPGFTNSLMGDSDGFVSRFSFEPRPLQRVMMEAASQMTAPGLMLVDAPMGEGKTEGASAASEILARRFGLTGMLFALPTQGTTDAMFDRISSWASSIAPDLVVSLVHGKAMLNEKWVELLENVDVSGIHEEDAACVDEYGLPCDGYGQSPKGSTTATPSSWLMGRHRSLLAPLVVCTIDQVLWAATRTRFVSLRHAGLSGKILVIDEVHAYDAYMSVFLYELLRWAARLGIPVILMSATLPDELRCRLVAAWRSGLPGEVASERARVGDYPVVEVHSPVGEPRFYTPQSHRSDQQVRVEVLDADLDDTRAIAAKAVAEVTEGGCALVILNTVQRAQEVWQAVEESGMPSLLLHGRLTAAERAKRTKEALAALGGPMRAKRMIVVATQIAEQSFDADADILITDLAPVDLFLQRIGRLFRHSDTLRPVGLTEPKVIVTGLSRRDDGLPTWPGSFEYIYGRSALLAAAAQILGTSQWSVPSCVPRYVQTAYGSTWDGPDSWRDEWLRARVAEQSDREEKERRADTFRLQPEGAKQSATLENLHRHASRAQEAADGRAVVRDIEDSLEVGLVVHDGHQYRTLSGRPLGPDGARAADAKVAREIMGDSVRLRWRPGMDEVRPLPCWVDHPVLGRWKVVVLDANFSGAIGSWPIRYDAQLGLTSP